MAPNILKSSLEDASFNIIFQILCRVVTFLLNAFVVRHVGQAVLGVMNVRLLLLESMILFLSREPFMKACLTNTAEHNWAQVVNLLWLTVPIGFVMSFFFGYIWLNLLSSSEVLPDYYTFAVWAIAISCVIELLSLVIQLVASAFLFVRLKIILETIMIAIRTITFLTIVIHRPENALLAFGVAQVVASIVYTGGLYLYFHRYIKSVKRPKLKRRLSLIDESEEFVMAEFPFRAITDFLPGQLENDDSILDKNLTILTWSFFKQGIFKQILTEGEKLIMTILPVLTFTEQGTYEIVNNLGSLAARFIFRPIEDSCYFYFTQMIQRDKPIQHQDVAKIQESANVLKHLCSTVASIGLIILTFGQSYSSLLLWLYGGSKLMTSLSILLLRVHCFAVLLLGINGVTECYTNATADSVTINKNNFIMIYESVAFLGASYVFSMWLGPVGFIIGNCINMGLRILHSILFINKRHSDSQYRPLQGLVPKPYFSGSLIVAGIITSLSEAYFFDENKILHLGIGVLMAAIVAIAWFIEHQELLRLGLNKWYERRLSRQKSD